MKNPGAVLAFLATAAVVKGSDNRGSSGCPCIPSSHERLKASHILVDCPRTFATDGKCIEVIVKQRSHFYPPEYGRECGIYKEPGSASCWNLNGTIYEPTPANSTNGTRRLNTTNATGTPNNSANGANNGSNGTTGTNNGSNGTSGTGGTSDGATPSPTPAPTPWDHGVELEIGAAARADWCDEQWCYIDECNCNAADASQSTYFGADKIMFYSYSTCGGSDTYTSEETGVVKGAKDCVAGDNSASSTVRLCPMHAWVAISAVLSCILLQYSATS